MEAEKNLQGELARKKDEETATIKTEVKPEVKKTGSPVLAACLEAGQVTFWKTLYIRPEEVDESKKKQGHGFVHRATNLFDDADLEDMRFFLTSEGTAAAKEKLHPAQYVAVAARRKGGDDTMEMLVVENSIEQVVDLGSGSDPAMRSLKRKFPNINCFEVDFEEVLKPKILKQDEELKQNNKKAEVKHVIGDFRKNVLNRLEEKGLNLGKDIIFQMKGVTQYTSPEDFQAFLKEIMTKAKGRVFLIADYTKRTMFEPAANENYESTQEVHKKFGAHVAYNNMKKFMEDQGFYVTSDVTLHEIMGNYGLGTDPQPSLKHWGMFVATNKPLEPAHNFTPKS